MLHFEKRIRYHEKLVYPTWPNKEIGVKGAQPKSFWTQHIDNRHLLLRLLVPVPGWHEKDETLPLPLSNVVIGSADPVLIWLLFVASRFSSAPWSVDGSNGFQRSEEPNRTELIHWIQLHKNPRDNDRVDLTQDSRYLSPFVLICRCGSGRWPPPCPWPPMLTTEPCRFAPNPYLVSDDPRAALTPIFQSCLQDQGWALQVGLSIAQDHPESRKEYCKSTYCGLSQCCEWPRWEWISWGERSWVWCCRLNIYPTWCTKGPSCGCAHTWRRWGQLITASISDWPPDWRILGDKRKKGSSYTPTPVQKTV